MFPSFLSRACFLPHYLFLSFSFPLIFCLQLGGRVSGTAPNSCIIVFSDTFFIPCEFMGLLLFTKQCSSLIWPAYDPHLQRKKQEPRETNSLTQGHKASHWRLGCRPTWSWLENCALNIVLFFSDSIVCFSPNSVKCYFKISLRLTLTTDFHRCFKSGKQEMVF